jgi:hypothetical protein
LAAFKDPYYANIVLDSLASCLGTWNINPKDYAGLFKEIADALKKHEVTPAPDRPEDMARYNRLKKEILDYLDGKGPLPNPDETPAPDKDAKPGEKPAPAAEGGAKPAAPEKDAAEKP